MPSDVVIGWATATLTDITTGITTTPLQPACVASSGWTPVVVPVAGQHSGHFAALAGSPAGSDGGSSIAQTFTAASGDTGVAFWYDANCQSFNFGTDGASATLADNTAGSTSTVFGPDCPIGDQGWIQVNAPIIAGHSYTLTLTNTDTSNSSYFPTYTLFDDIDLY